MPVRLRPLGPDDAELLARLYTSQRAFLAPYDPERPDSFFTVAGQRRELELLQDERAHDRLYRFLIEFDENAAGVVSVSRIARGPFQNAGIGYWVRRDMNGQGVATRAVRLVCEWGFSEGRLHRIEAATLLDNYGSQTVLRRNDFAEIGISRRYLKIAGEWRDHVLFARTAD